MKYRINTEILPGGRILTETQIQIGDMLETISRNVIMTEDKQVKAALVRLGWTPPGISPNAKRFGTLFGVIEIIEDPLVPEDEIRLNDHTGKLLAKLLHVGA